jgi:hypothetical protein
MIFKPLILPIIAWSIAATVLSVPIQVMAVYGHGLAEYSAVFGKLTILNWLVMAFGLVTAVLLDRGSPHARVFVPILIALVIANNWVVAVFTTDFTPFAASLGSLLFATLNLPLLHPKIRNLFKHPELRWWMRPERACAAVPVFLGGFLREAFRAETFDLSETGAFVQIPPQKISLEVQEAISLCLTIGTYSQIRCTGRVVRIAEASGTYPAGVGVEFVGLAYRQKREIRRFIARHNLLVNS